MDGLTVLILIGVLAFVVAGAGFAFAQPRRFTDKDADGAPDATAEEAPRRKRTTAGSSAAEALSRNKKAAPKGG